MRTGAVAVEIIPAGGEMEALAPPTPTTTAVAPDARLTVSALERVIGGPPGVRVWELTM